MYMQNLILYLDDVLAGFMLPQPFRKPITKYKKSSFFHPPPLTETVKKVKIYVVYVKNVYQGSYH